MTRRAVGESLWLVFDRSDLRIRVLCRSDPEDLPRVASWTATFAAARSSLADAAGAVGLWPSVAPDEAAADVSVPLIRRPLPVSGGRVHSFTATIRSGRITGVSVFDEPPDWV
jgi:hypothetical protein